MIPSIMKRLKYFFYKIKYFYIFWIQKITHVTVSIIFYVCVKDFFFIPNPVIIFITMYIYTYYTILIFKM